MHFRDRKEAGQMLADALTEYKDSDVVVYALPRGGVVLGAQIASGLDAPLDLVVPRKVGHPEQPEYGICAVTDEGHLVCSKREVALLDPAWLTTEVQKEQAEAKRRRRKYLAKRPSLPVTGKTAIIVDDGVATGLTMLAAVEDVKNRNPKRVVLATPVIPKDLAVRLERYVNDLVALDRPAVYLGAVGAYYDNFDQVEDKEVTNLMKKKSPPAKKTRSER
jgi:predicted phosphoribosyltransferase